MRKEQEHRHSLLEDMSDVPRFEIIRTPIGIGGDQQHLNATDKARANYMAKLCGNRPARDCLILPGVLYQGLALHR